MNVLVDTSVWVDHFRKRNDALIGLIEKDLVLNHPMVLAELACGTPPSPRTQTLKSVALLRPCHQASLSEVMDFIEREKLYGLGCGLVDMCLLASTCSGQVRADTFSSCSRQLDFPWRLVAQGRVEPAAVVLHLDVFDHVPPCGLSASVSLASQPLAFQ